MAESPLAHIEESSAPEAMAARAGTLSSEEALVRRCQSGDLTAFDLLMQQHEAKVYNIAYRMLGNPDDASDAAQEAFIRAFHALPKFRHECAFSTWLYRIVVNICRDAARRRARQGIFVEPPAHEDEELDLLDNLPDTHPSPEEAVLRRALQEAVHRAIDSLPPIHRDVIVLFDLEGFSYEEAAAMLKTSVGTVKSRLNRARLALKAKLEPLMEQF